MAASKRADPDRDASFRTSDEPTLWAEFTTSTMRSTNRVHPARRIAGKELAMIRCRSVK